MKKFALACAVAASVLAGPAQAVVIDFNDLAVDTIVKDQYADQGVIFSAYENDVEVALAVISSGSSGDNHYLGNTTSSGFFDRHDLVRLDFSGVVESLSLDILPYGWNDITLNAYGVTGELLESLSVGNGTQVANASFTVTGIARLDVLQPTDLWAYGLDNIRFELAAPVADVPEPAALGLLGLGLLGVAGLRRRKAA